MAEHTTGQDTNGGGPEADDLDAVADRLEVALERIARRLDTKAPCGTAPELAARLDGLIERLRDVLGSAVADRDTTG